MAAFCQVTRPESLLLQGSVLLFFTYHPILRQRESFCRIPGWHCKKKNGEMLSYTCTGSCNHAASSEGGWEEMWRWVFILGSFPSPILSKGKWEKISWRSHWLPLAPAIVLQTSQPLNIGSNDSGIMTCPFCKGGNNVSDSKCGEKEKQILGKREKTQPVFQAVLF